MKKCTVFSPKVKDITRMLTKPIIPILVFFILFTNIEPSDADINFIAIADSPYTGKEFYLIEKELQNLPAETKFIIHLGDIQASTNNCDDKNYKDIISLLKQASKPVFFVPGDNDYWDCKYADKSKQLWDQYILEFEKRWDNEFSVARQKEQQENFSFLLDNTLFIGISSFFLDDPATFKKMWRNNSLWLENNFKKYGQRVKNLIIFAHDFSAIRKKGRDESLTGCKLPRWEKNKKQRRVLRKRFISLAQGFKKPILFLQGDYHCWVHDHPFEDAKNIIRIVANKTENAPLAQITIDKNTFYIDQRSNARIDYLLKSANSGDVWSQYLLGEEYWKVQKYKKAKQWLEKASAQKFSPAISALGERYLLTWRDPKEAWKLFESVTKSTDAKLFLSKHEESFPSYKNRINQYHENTLQKSTASGFFYLGYSHMTGKGAKIDYEKAIKYFKKSGKIGNIGAAYFNLAAMYSGGMGVKKNYREAKFWCSKGADLGVPACKFMLGTMYLKGLGVKQSYKEAAKWFKFLPNDHNSLHNLGIFYFKGLGVSQSMDIALEYFKKAASLGSPHSKAILKKLAETEKN